jgi:DNA-binding GntR family transcriptional regulator
MGTTRRQKPQGSRSASSSRGARGAAPAAGFRPTGAQVVYEALRRAIMALELAPGANLEEAQLCRQYKVSRTPVREALIRLASEGLAEITPNQGARVATLDFVDVVDHYEAMDVFQPITCHFAAVRRTPEDLAAIRKRLRRFRDAVASKNPAEMIRCNYDLHWTIAGACHNRCIERGYRQMLADKLRLLQHGLAGTAHGKGHALADRFRGTATISVRLVHAIGRGDGVEAAQVARELNAFVRAQVVDYFSSSLASEITLPQPSLRSEPAAQETTRFRRPTQR